MSLSNNQKQQIAALLKAKINDKLAKYARETSSMPFLTKIMQDNEKVAAYSFIHSISTMLGMSIYEQIAKIIALDNFDVVETGYDVKGTISNEKNLIITKIMQEIKNGTRKADKEQEIREILKADSNSGRQIKIRADLFLKKGKDEYYIEIKTAKPNIDVFSKSKQKLLEWVAIRKKTVKTILAIPYNPYHPEPYNRFTIQGVLDEERELYVADRFWDLLGGKGTYKELLGVFDEIGKELRDKIQQKITEVAKSKIGP